jgi:hypothetical protein
MRRIICDVCGTTADGDAFVTPGKLVHVMVGVDIRATFDLCSDRCVTRMIERIRATLGPGSVGPGAGEGPSMSARK